MDVCGKIVVVTGGGSGLGRFIAEAFRRAGAHVLAADRQAAGNITVADVTTETGRAAVLTEAQQVGGLDVLVNNAGGWSLGGEQFPDAQPAAWRAVVELNLLSPMALTQQALPAMGRRGGAIVNIASSAGVDTSAYGSPEYGAAKAGLIRFTTALADWRERYGVRVNCIVPGWIGLERAHAECAAMSPLERATTPALVPPELIAAQTLRLAQDESLAGRVVTMLNEDQPPGLS